MRPDEDVRLWGSLFELQLLELSTQFPTSTVDIGAGSAVGVLIPGLPDTIPAHLAIVTPTDPGAKMVRHSDFPSICDYQ